MAPLPLLPPHQSTDMPTLLQAAQQAGHRVALFSIVAFLLVGLLLLGVGKYWNRTALIHGFIAAVVPAGPFLFEGMLSGGEYDLPNN